MRPLFSSHRLETVEGVAQLLRDAGIEVRVTHGRGYAGKRRRHFSFREQDTAQPLPTVWVIQSSEQVRARGLLREAGLIDSTREPASAPAFRFQPTSQVGRGGGKRLLMVKFGLMGGIALVMVLAIVRTLSQAPQVAQLASPPFDGRVAPTLQPVAQAVFIKEIEKRDPTVLCMSVDGADAPRDVIAATGGSMGGKRMVVPGSHCVRVADSDAGSYHKTSGGEAMILEVSGFRPSAPDAGTVEFSAYQHRLWARYKTLEVRRINGQWQVVRTIKHVST